MIKGLNRVTGFGRLNSCIRNNRQQEVDRVLVAREMIQANIGPCVKTTNLFLK